MPTALEPIFRGLTRIFNTPLIPGDSTLTLWLIVKLLLATIAVFALIRLLRQFLKSRLLAPMKLEGSNREAVATLISYSIGAIAFFALIQGIGFQLESLAVIVGSLGVGIGFGLQDLTKNSVSGLTLLLEGKVKVGDFIEFDDLSGYVQAISLRSMVIRTREGGDVVVPNSQLVENRVLNWNYDSPRGRIHIPVGVAYGSDPVLVTEALLNAAYADPSVLHEPPPHVLFSGFGESSLDFELRLWVVGYDREPYVRSALNFLIEHNLRQHGLVVPLPQRDLWLRNPEDLRSPAPIPAIASDTAAPIQRYLEEQQGGTAKPAAKPRFIRDLLRQVVYFQNLGDLELRQLIEIGYRKRLRPGETLFKQGDPGDAFYIVLSGAVEVYAQKLDKHLATLVVGKFFGELSLMLGIPRTATVKAEQEATLFAINTQGFRRLLQEHPEFAEAIVQELSKHQQELNDRRRQLQDLGLDDTGEEKNVVDWLRKRIKKLFAL
ncbi:MAG: mechanosensitive ion channel [Spirulinaceae cyanobacterium SM2_1_0]|nr:mechanosensitive ion channel [Spirulinaceae cyanobacterium SM2_1_0]